jgi:protein phosphatase PTC7
MLSTMPLYPGDVLILGSDGLFDNVADENIVEVVDRVLTTGGKPSDISQALAFKAFEASTDKSSTTPYSLAASEAFEMIYDGGKKDDISVVACILS